jgi:hypothetical protein
MMVSREMQTEREYERMLALLRDIVAASDANDDDALMNCLERARKLVVEIDANE